MTSSRKGERVFTPLIRELPPSISLEIGRIIVHWSFYEHAIQMFIYRLLSLVDSVGRLTVREPRITDRIEMVLDIAAAKNIEINIETWRGLKKIAEHLALVRHLLAHGAWTKKGDDTYMVVMTTGSHPKTVEHHRSRKAEPEGIMVDVNGLSSVLKEIQDLTITTGFEIDKIIAKLPSSPGK